MKNRVISSILVFTLFFGTAAGLAYLFYKNMNDCPGEGNVIVSQAFLDSLQAVASQPPDTIKKDTTIYLDRIIYKSKDPVEPRDSIPDDDLRLYQDSIKNDSVATGVSFWVKGRLEGPITLWTEPVVKLSSTTITKPLPMPLPYEKPVPQTGLYGLGGIGGGSQGVKISTTILYLNNQGKIFGGEIGYYGGTYAEIKYGIKF